MSTEISPTPEVVPEVKETEEAKKPETPTQPKPTEPSQVVLTKPNLAKVNEDKGRVLSLKNEKNNVFSRALNQELPCEFFPV